MATNKLLSLVVVALCLTKTFSDPMACKTKPMGTVLPKDDDCHQYILCLYQTAFTKSCPIGEGFSRAAKGCVDYNKSDCQMKPSKPTLDPSVGTGGTCINEESPANRKACKDQAFGALVSHPRNCSMFLVCDCENPTVKMCAAGTVFDDQLKICNFPYNAKCVEGSGAGETTKTTPKSVTTPESIEWGQNCKAPAGISADVCVTRHDGVLLQYPYDCYAYINCTRGCPVKNYCPTDKIFNDVLKVCEPFDKVQCTKMPIPPTSFTTEKPLITVTGHTSITMPETSTTSKLTTTTIAPEHCEHPLGVEANICSDQLAAKYQIYPYNCHAYIVCKGVKPCLKYCENNTIFDSLLGICDNDTKCQEISIPTHITAESTTVSTPVNDSTTPPPHVNPDLCQGKTDLSIYPYAEDCTKYLLCENNVLKLEMCPTGWLFNSKLMLCDKASEDVCYRNVMPTTPVPPTTAKCGPNVSSKACLETTTKSPHQQKCLNKPVGFTYPYEGTCSQYIYCKGNGNFLLLSCPKDNYFYRDSGSCGPIDDKRKCVETKTTISGLTTLAQTSTSTPLPFTAYTTTLKPSLNRCGNFSNGQLVPYPDNCRRYISCVRPVPIGLYCNFNWHFNEQLQKCIPDNEDVYTDTNLNQTANAICQGLKSGDRQVYSGHCKLYYECLEEGNYMLRACTQETYFDPIKEQCSSNVGPAYCKKHFDSNPTSQGICKGQTLDKKVSYPHNCTKYIKCKSPIPVAFNCNNNLQFSSAVQDCVESSQSDCSDDTKAAANNSNTIPPTTKPFNQCENKNDFTLMAHKDNCSVVILCLNNTEYLAHCKPGLYFDLAAGECLSSENKESCRVSTVSENSHLITCQNTLNGVRFSHPNNCTKYIECQNHLKVQHDCPKGLEFSAIEKKCLIPELAECRIPIAISTSTVETSTVKSTTPHTTKAKTTTINTCKVNVTTTTEPIMKTTITPTIPEAIQDNICCGQKSGTYLPYPDNKKKFVKCQYPLPKIYTCPEGTFYKENISSCN